MWLRISRFIALAAAAALIASSPAQAQGQANTWVFERYVVYSKLNPHVVVTGQNVTTVGGQPQPQPQSQPQPQPPGPGGGGFISKPGGGFTSLPGHGITAERGVDRPGSDYKQFDLPQADMSTCLTDCALDVNCKAYTYVRPGVQGPNARCYLKNAVPPPRPSNCCSSGVKQ